MSDFVNSIPDWYLAVGGVFGFIVFTGIFVSSIQSTDGAALIMVWTALIAAAIASLLWPLIVFLPIAMSTYAFTSRNKHGRFTPEMTARLAAAASYGPLSLEILSKLAQEDVFANAGVTTRGLVAKARTMGLPYQKVTRDPIEHEQ